MEFKRNKIFDDLIINIKEDDSVLEKLDYEQLDLFVNYLTELNNYLKDKKGE